MSALKSDRLPFPPLTLKVEPETPPPTFKLKPEDGRTQPRLWVRRLVIWRKPGDVIQDIPLRAGLNIIWSPDQSTEDAPIAHGSGKSTFCRLLRYCLGEKSFAPVDQERSMRNRFPQGGVGAEVVIEGLDWSVVRSFRNQEQDVVTANSKLNPAMLEYGTPTGISPLTDEIGRGILGDLPQWMPLCLGKSGLWDAALALVTRDQECRFGDHLRWRHKESDSGSPTMTWENRVLVIRSLIKALVKDEAEIQQNYTKASAQLIEKKKFLEMCDWRIMEEYGVLQGILKIELGNSFINPDPLITEAEAQLNIAKKLPIKSTDTSLKDAQFKREQAQSEFSQIDAELKENLIRIDEKEKRLAKLQAVPIEVDDCLTPDGNAICPALRVPLEDAFDLGCLLSSTSYLDPRNARLKKRVEDIGEEEEDIRILKSTTPRLKEDVALAQAQLESLTDEVKLFTSGLSENHKVVQNARSLLVQSKLLKERIVDRATVLGSLEEQESVVHGLRTKLTSQQTKSGHPVQVLSNRFDAVLKELSSKRMEGRVKLDGPSLNHLEVRFDGQRTTTALKTLGVIAFDLAVLIMTIEGKTYLPGLLIHDSPREADLSNSIYARLFQFAKKLEGEENTPLFQYIITTTTDPPEEFRTKDWLCLKVDGAPAEHRLLKNDL